MNAFNINSYHSPTKFLQPANLNYLHYLISVQSTGRTRSSSLVTSSTIRIFLITNHQRDQPLFHICITLPVESFPSSFHHLILFTVLLVHLTLRISPYHSHHLRSHHLSLPLPNIPENSSLSQSLSSIVTLIPSGLTSRIFNLY